MKLITTCMQCLHERGRPSDERIEVDITNDGILRGRCSQGHAVAQCIQGKKFELLYDIALAAFADGYFRESVATATSAYEQFLEFYIETAAAKYNVGAEPFVETWNLLASQSERQFGAFIALFTVENGVRPRVLESRHVEFRNRVIHRGYLPTEQEAYEYLRRIFEFISVVLASVKEHMYEQMLEVVRRELLQRINAARASGEPQVTTIAMGTALSTSTARSSDTNDFSAALATFRSRRHIFYR